MLSENMMNIDKSINMTFSDIMILNINVLFFFEITDFWIKLLLTHCSCIIVLRYIDLKKILISKIVVKKLIFEWFFLNPMSIRIFQNTQDFLDQEIWIFSDSQNAFKSIKNVHCTGIARDIRKNIKFLVNKGFIFNFQWIPGHMDISGNEKADTMAKLGQLLLGWPAVRCGVKRPKS